MRSSEESFEKRSLERKLEAPGGFEPPIEVLQTSALATWRRRPLSCIGWGKEENGAGEGIRTLDLNLGKVVLYH